MSALTITAKRQGKTAKFDVAAHNGSPLYADTIRLGEAPERARFAEAVTKVAPGNDAAEVEKVLLKLATAEVTKADAPESGSLTDVAEVDISRIIRPELFITSDVCGICVPKAVQNNGETVGRWVMHLRWSNGRREMKDVASTLDLTGGQRLFIHPVPAAPSPSLRPSWSAQSRRAWSGNAPAPDASEVFKRLCEALADYLDFPPERAPGNTALLALFVMLSYVYPAWNAVPYLYVGGPIGSGKSRVFELLNLLVFRPLASSNLTAALLFRSLHERGGVLLLDEAERLKESTPDAAELRSILLAGYKRGGKAQRCKPETFELQEFDVFGPKAIACIAGLPGALSSRCITVMMFRCPHGSIKPKKRLDDDAARWSDLRDDLHLLALESGAVTLDLSRRAEVCTSMTGRNYELWQPLLAMASWIESCGANGLLALMQEHAATLIADAMDDIIPDADETLLRMLAALAVRNQTPQPKEILAAAKEEEPEAFTTFKAKGVATILKRYGLRTVKVHGEKRYRVSIAEIRKIETTYGFNLNLPPVED
jgi:hypothetical protein